MRYWYLIQFLSYVFASNVAASSTITQITWLQSDNPPFHIAKSIKAPNGGLCDYLTEELIKQLPNIKHTRTIVPQARIGKYLDDGHTACYPCMIYREKNTTRAAYSIPTTVYPAFSVIAAPQKAQQITQRHGDPVQLVKLLTDKKFIFGKSAARKFSPEINQIAHNTKVYENASLSWSSENESNAVIARLNHGYIDYTIDYPFMADYYNRFSAQDNVTTLAISDNENNMVLGAIGCSASSANDFAKKLLPQINTILQQKILPSKEYQSSQRQWLEHTFSDFNTRYQQYVLQFKPQANAALK